MKKSLCTIGLLALVAALAGCSSPAQDASSTEAALNLQVQQSSLTGTFARSGSLAQFQSSFDGANKGRLHIDINSQPVDIEVDRDTNSVTFDGHNGALYQEDIDALSALASSLRDRNNLTDSEDLLLRGVTYLSEAPVGLTLGQRQNLRVPSAVEENKIRKGMVVGTHNPDGTVSVQGVMNAQGQVIPTAGVSANPAEANQDCQVNGQDGVLYFSCTVTTRWIEHDASSHCFTGESAICGKDGDHCRGGCGPGCTNLHIYTYDCGDHDWCIYYHGGSAVTPLNSDCGDEYGDAADDFLLGWPNC
jgi:hypothetical protein